MSIPSSMRYVEITTPGAPDVLRVTQGSVPSFAPSEVLIKVSAAGINRPDVLQRMGKYAVPSNASKIPGLEVAGEVVACGKRASQFSVGDKVCALTNGGGYAEYVAVPQGQCLDIPDGLSMVEAAAIPETFFTVWANVFNLGQLRAGQRFLVHGGSSGIGTTAIALAKACGAYVIATVSSEAKAQACRDLGADEVINYQEQDFVEQVNNITDNKGVDVILDMVGGDYVNRNLQIAAMDAHVVIIASLRGATAQINIGYIMAKRISLMGSLLRPRTDQQKADIASQLAQTVWPWIEQGSVRPVVFKTYRLDQADEAHTLMESSQHIGKLVMQLDN